MRAVALSEAERTEVWNRRQQGEAVHLIARRMGRLVGTIGWHVRTTGGVRPRPRHRAPGDLSVAEREEISRGLAAGISSRAIAYSVWRAPSTVSREIARNKGRNEYRAEFAEAATQRRARRPKEKKLAGNLRLRGEVVAGLKQYWSPQQIAGWLSITYPNDLEMRVSHETIYLSLYVQGRGALRRELTTCLRSGRQLRRPKGVRRRYGGGQLKDKVLISERPAEVEDRAVPGHWEGDLVFGSERSVIGTLVERTSRFVMLVALPQGVKASFVREALTASILTLPDSLRGSLTWDQGTEMAEHLQFSIDTGVDVYFCNPRSPWQRGSNENTNGLLRQYFPKRRSVAGYSQPQLDAVAAQLNGRPRQTLGWRSPAQKFADILATAPH